MKPQDEYLSIAEFAKRARVTPRAVYKRINEPVREHDENPCVNHIKMVDGKKRISTAALILFNVNRYEPVHELVHEQCEPVREQTENQILTILQENMEVLKSELEFKNKQLETKDKQIEDLSKANDRLNDRLQEANQLNHQNQILLEQKQQPEPIENEDIPPKSTKKHFWVWIKSKFI